MIRHRVTVMGACPSVADRPKVAIKARMPSGLDGNPNPIRSERRDALLAAIARDVHAMDRRVLLVGVDGSPGSGKSTFADELAARISRLGRSVVRSTTDSFHNPRSIRSRRGLNSAQSYFLDSHNNDVLRSDLLEPLRAGRSFRTAHFDEPTDREVTEAWEAPLGDLVLVFDGLFLQRPELAAYWDFSIFLDASERRERNFQRWSSTADPEKVAFAAERYRAGWKLYVETCSPSERADRVILNNDFADPLRIR